MRAAPNYYLKKQLWFKTRFDKDLNFTDVELVNRNVEIWISDSAESIGPENLIGVTFSKHQSKVSLTIGDFGDWKCIYFSKDDQTLKKSDQRDKKYYFDIEFDSEINELLETTQFKIRVSE